MYHYNYISPPEHSSRGEMTGLLANLIVASLAAVHASVLPGSGGEAAWIDVCDYQDPTGSKCCAPGMVDHKYQVLPALHDWDGHDQQCR